MTQCGRRESQIPRPVSQSQARQGRGTTGRALIGFMNSPILLSPLAGDVLGSATDDFVIAEWQDAGAPPGPPRYIAPLHLHRKDDEAWYVLEGTLRVKTGDDEVELRAGSGVLVPHGTPHTYWNPISERVRYLLVMTSRIYRLIQEIHATKERTPAIMHALFEKFDSELLSSPSFGSGAV